MSMLGAYVRYLVSYLKGKAVSHQVMSERSRADLQHDNWKHALHRVGEPIKLTRCGRSTLDRRLERVRDYPCGSNNRQKRHSYLCASHQVAEQADLQSGVQRQASGGAKPAEEEEGARALHSRYRGEVTHVQVVDGLLKAARGRTVQDVPQAANEDDDADYADNDHKEPKEREEDQAGLVLQDAGEDQVAVKGQPGFLHLPDVRSV